MCSVYLTIRTQYNWGVAFGIAAIVFQLFEIEDKLKKQ